MFKRKITCLAAGLLLAGALAGCSSEVSSDGVKSVKGDLVVTGDTLLSHVCVAQSRYYPGDRIVFRALVTDSKNNEIVESANVKLVLDNGEELPMVLGKHGEEATQLWSVGYDVPADAPTGTIDYKIVAENGNKKAEFEPFNVSLSKVTIVEPGTPVGGEEAKKALEAAAKK